MSMTDKKSKIIFFLVGVLIIMSIVATYYKVFIYNDFEIITEE